MRKTILALTLAAAFALPAHADQVIVEDNGRPFDFRFNFDLGEINFGDMLAQADGARVHVDTETLTQDWSA